MAEPRVGYIDRPVAALEVQNLSEKMLEQCLQDDVDNILQRWPRRL